MLNKTDLLSAEACDAACDEITAGMEWDGPVYRISAINRVGVDTLCQDIMTFLENHESI